MSFCFSLSAGASILISQSVGANDKEHIEEYAGAMIKFNNIIPVFLFFSVIDHTSAYTQQLLFFYHWYYKIFKSLAHQRMTDNKMDRRCFILRDDNTFSFMDPDLYIPEGMIIF